MAFISPCYLNTSFCGHLLAHFLLFINKTDFFFPLLTRKTACPVYLSSQKLSFQKFWMPRAVLRLIPGYPKCCCNSYSIVSSLSLACFSTLMAGTRAWLRSEQAAAAGWDFLSFPAGIYSPPGRLQQPGAAPQKVLLKLLHPHLTPGLTLVGFAQQQSSAGGAALLKDHSRLGRDFEENSCIDTKTEKTR